MKNLIILLVLVALLVSVSALLLDAEVARREWRGRIPARKTSHFVRARAAILKSLVMPDPYMIMRMHKQ